MTTVCHRAFRFFLAAIWLAGSVPGATVLDSLGHQGSGTATAFDRHDCGDHERHIPLAALHGCATDGFSNHREGLPPGSNPAVRPNVIERLSFGPCLHISSVSVLAVTGVRGPPGL
jgi:hypothetical protein